MTRHKTLVNLDRELLAEATRILGATTKTGTIDLALREVVRRACAIEFMRLAHEGAFRSAEPDE